MAGVGARSAAQGMRHSRGMRRLRPRRPPVRFPSGSAWRLSGPARPVRTRRRPRSPDHPLSLARSQSHRPKKATIRLRATRGRSSRSERREKIGAIGNAGRLDAYSPCRAVRRPAGIPDPVGLAGRSSAAEIREARRWTRPGPVGPEIVHGRRGRGPSAAAFRGSSGSPAQGDTARSRSDRRIRRAVRAFAGIEPATSAAQEARRGGPSRLPAARRRGPGVPRPRLDGVLVLR